MLLWLIPSVHNWFVESGTPLYWKAAFYGFCSSASLPLGAAVGLWAHPVDPKQCALIVAFGAGALIFAVSTELYAEALRHVEEDASNFAVAEIGTSMVCAVFGAVLFTLMNEKLEQWTTSHSPLPASARHELEVEAKEPAPSREGEPLLPQQKSFRHPEVEKIEAKQDTGKQVAMAMWLGVAMDGIPEAILLGFITNEKAMTVAFIVSIFVANFPEAFSSASMLRAKTEMSGMQIFLLWGSLCVITTILAACASAVLPHDLHSQPHGKGGWADAVVLTGAAIEGLAGGAMMAMVCATMLPEAFHHGGKWSGVCAVLGFLMSCTVKVYFGRASSSDVEANQAVVTEELVEKELVDPLVDPLEQVVQAAFLAVHRRFH